MQKTLGGDRLGAGKKMKVELHNYERSTHDLGYIWRSTMAAGTLVPFMSEIALPGDTFDINLGCDIKTHPTIGPLFGSYKVQLDVFQAPIRLYNSLLHNNYLGIGMNMKQVLFPVIELLAQPSAMLPAGINQDNTQINPSSLPAYLGIRGIGTTAENDIPRKFNAIPILAYWEIYKNYYANKQEEIGAVLHTPSIALVNTVDTIEIDTAALSEAPSTSPMFLLSGSIIEIAYTGAPPILTQIIIGTQDYGPQTIADLFTGLSDSGTIITGNYNSAIWNDTRISNWRYHTLSDLEVGKPSISTFPLSNIDDMRTEILATSNLAAPFKINDANFEPYTWLYEQPAGIPNLLSSQEGLALKTYQSDLLNNWLSTEWIDGVNGINQITAIDTSGGEFTLDTLNLAKKVYDMLNRIAVSGGSYDDWLDAVYTHDRYTRCESPMYMGGLSKELVFQEVVSNSQSEGQPLGTLAGKGIMANKHKGGTIIVRVDEPSYIMGIISLTPRIDYSQGNKWDINLKTMDDLHKPALDEIGFQELITEQMAWWETSWDTINDVWVQKSAGKQPAWINYMTNINQTRGNFAINENEMFMTLNRRYEMNSITGQIKDLTTYIDPSKFNFIFAETSLDAQNFWAQIAVDITARRKMSAKIMPNL